MSYIPLISFVWFNSISLYTGGSVLMILLFRAFSPLQCISFYDADKRCMNQWLVSSIHNYYDFSPVTIRINGCLMRYSLNELPGCVTGAIHIQRTCKHRKERYSAGITCFGVSSIFIMLIECLSLHSCIIHTCTHGYIKVCSGST